MTLIAAFSIKEPSIQRTPCINILPLKTTCWSVFEATGSLIKRLPSGLPPFKDSLDKGAVLF